MRWRFDPEQSHQLDAIRSVVDLFEGQSMGSSEPGPNPELMPREALLQNLRRVQEEQGLPLSGDLADTQLSVEMETGTGKTYVYLRTIMELYKRYRFRRFVVVTPGVAIREGVLHQVAATRDHLAELYEGQRLEARVARPDQPGIIRRFAEDDGPQVLVVNIDAINKGAGNVLHRPADGLSGWSPMERVAASRPIVILDEPQNLEGPRSREALKALDPLVTLRYSATHRVLHHLVHRLDPVRAHDMGLVKRIEVASVVAEGRPSVPLELRSLRSTTKGVTATLALEGSTPRGPRWTSVKVRGHGEDLEQLSGGRPLYKGYLVDEINAASSSVRFTNGVVLPLQGIGPNTDVVREQVALTIREHLERELLIQRVTPVGRRMKVLSLFFLDRVAHYAPADGLVRRVFEELYEQIGAEPRYASLASSPVGEVHAGYFARRSGVEIDTSGSSREDGEAFELIMRNKERLLSLDEPVRFLFSHSALREGWDNPNVFQICTLHPTRSHLRKRQEIGRGLRLPVTETGHRCHERDLNRLLVVANEHYDDFARRLQAEIQDDCGSDFSGRIADHRVTRALPLRAGWEEDEATQRLWRIIGRRLQCRPEFDREALVKASLSALRALPRSDEEPALRVERVALDGEGRAARRDVERRALSERDPVAESVPNVLLWLQEQTGLTRGTLAQILIDSGLVRDVIRDPMGSVEMISGVLRRVVAEQGSHGASYERADELPYPWLGHRPLMARARQVPLSRGVHQEAPIRDDREAAWVQSADKDPSTVRLLRWPRWLKVETPQGAVDPGWARLWRDDAGQESIEVVRCSGPALSAAQSAASRAWFETLGVDYKELGG